MLLDRDELFTTLPNSWQPLRELQVRRYWEVQSEQLLEIHVCEFGHADSAYHFCIESVRNIRHPPKDDSWWQSFGHKFQFGSIRADEIRERHMQNSGNHWKESREALEECGAIIEAVTLFDEWNVWWIIGRSEKAWIAIYWDTTA